MYFHSVAGIQRVCVGPIAQTRHTLPACPHISYYLSRSMLMKLLFDTAMEQFDRSREVSGVAEILRPEGGNIFNNIYLQVKSS